MKYKILFVIQFLELIMFIFLAFFIDDLLGTINQRQKDIDILSGKYEECGKYNQFIDVKNEVASIPYDPESNNCYDHTKKLQSKLYERGIESSIMINQNRNHAWLAVWIESNTGQFIKPDAGFNILEIRDRKLDVVCENNKLK